MTVDIDRLIGWLVDNFDKCPCNINNYDEVMYESLSEEWFEKNCDVKGGKK